MLVARLRFGSLLFELLALTACSDSRASRGDAGSSARDASIDSGASARDASNVAGANARDAGHDAGAPLDISAINCARTSLGQGWKLPVLPTLLGCRTHADCTRLPHGSCVGYPHMRCDYASGPGPFNDLCAIDADCVNDVGGYCTEALEATQCVYDECSIDADCGPDRVCLCAAGGGRHYCVSDGCHSDADCEAGRQCRSDMSFSGAYPQWHCSTANDTCREHTDCPSGDDRYCGYDVPLHRWLCRPFTIVD